MSAPQPVLPRDVVWKAQPALPPGGEVAVLLGEPASAGPFVIRIRTPPSMRVMPHVHPENRVYTVLEGVFFLGFGETFEPRELKELPAGSVVGIPALRPHFQYSDRTGYTVQIEGLGPTATTYVTLSDDPRRASSRAAPPN
jgi:hypothetical protein